MNNLDKYLNIVNEEKEKLGLDSYISLYPMFRVENNNLYVGVLLVNENDSVWNASENVKPAYWVLIDLNNDNIVSFNKTDEKDFVIGDLIPKNIDCKEKEISKYTVEKTMQYKNYLIEDIKNSELPLQKKLSNILGTKVEIDGEMVNINDYLLSNLEEQIKTKIDELVGVLIQSKYSSVIFYYDALVKQIITKYKKTKEIDVEQLKLCIEIMNNYYDGVIAIDNFFNI
jgi:hypothetical protein